MVPAPRANATRRMHALDLTLECELLTLHQPEQWNTELGLHDAANASTGPKEALQWIIAVDTKSFEELEDPDLADPYVADINLKDIHYDTLF